MASAATAGASPAKRSMTVSREFEESIRSDDDSAAQYTQEKAGEWAFEAQDRLGNMIGGAITFGVALMIIILMALVTGYFVAEVPSDGAFSESINTTADVGGTGFVIFGVTLLAVPVVALIGYFFRSGLGGFINGGGMGR